MAIKALMLRKRLDDKRKLLEALRAKDAEFSAREAELVASIEEATTDDEQAAVDEAADSFTSDQEQHENEKNALEAEIAGLEAELEEVEKRTAKPPAHKTDKRKEALTMDTRKFFNMSNQERDAFFSDSAVKEFLQRTRELGRQSRAITGAELLIPDVVLGLIREEIPNYSKLYRHVMVRRVPGTSRLNIMGKIPEGVWTEMCAKLNELDLSFTAVEVDGYKVGGYIAICNAILEDSDISLATEIISSLSQAIGLALDKAILYGTGIKMPVGIVTRLAQTQAPDNPNTTRMWTDLSATNLLAISGKTDAALFKAMVESAGAAKNGMGGKFWAMNEATYSKLVVNAVSINASGAIVTGMSNTMPIIGGAIEILPFVPDGDIVGGYGERYLLAERAGTAVAQSEHVRFFEDQTVFKGTARYDGTPVIAESFVAMNINGVAPTTSVAFAPDEAN